MCNALAVSCYTARSRLSPLKPLRPAKKESPALCGADNPIDSARTAPVS
jgi:hypothetical protein